MLHNQDWSTVDLETLAPDAIPVTSYKPRGNRSRYDADYTHWGDDKSIAARDHYRVAWRKMAANTGERTLISGIIPPGCGPHRWSALCWNCLVGAAWSSLKQSA